ncbi:hypothetical protein DFH08DRAFT_449361 [Mycena albidolilacea]|uniref:Uncharacterized protein n=1 Tax=Mycena albidolilacea TaxID=1033008 RepID=A0AAD7ECA0_9AGAR|nr:hypothetical protein DFH08DRAFT_449361 [Mycena albidolilacea]
MEASSLVVQELWDAIIDYLHDSPKDLLSSALVCRAFVHRAQIHLFHSIVIASDRDPGAVPAIQLSSILAHSPHLIRYICDLTIGQCDTETLAPIVEVAWSHISAIALVHLDDSLAPALDLIGILVSLPSLRKITFQSNAWEAAHLHAVLANCNPSVHSLAFHSCSPEMTDTLPDVNSRLILSTRPTVTHLDLFFADTDPDFLLTAACPVDLSQLTHVKFGWCSGTGLSSFLVVFAQTIQSIDVDASGQSPPFSDNISKLNERTCRRS